MSGELAMEQKVTLHYAEPLPPHLARFGEHLVAGQLLGGRCPRCDRVYVPHRGYCPLCVVRITEADELTTTDRGIVASYTIITPVRYYGQTKTEPFVFASVLLDGTASPLRGQDVTGIPHEQLRAGLRVKAVWRPEEERTMKGLSARGGSGVDGAVTSFEPTGEPDVPPDAYRGYEF